jgi:MFS family permease
VLAGNATIQLAAEPEYRGRVTALWSMALVGSTAIGSPVIGVLSDVAGPRYALALGAVACLAAVAVGRWPGRVAGGKRSAAELRDEGVDDHRAEDDHEHAQCPQGDHRPPAELRAGDRSPCGGGELPGLQARSRDRAQSSAVSNGPAAASCGLGSVIDMVSTFLGAAPLESRVSFQARITAARLPVIAASTRVGYLLAGTRRSGTPRNALTSVARGESGGCRPNSARSMTPSPASPGRDPRVPVNPQTRYRRPLTPRLPLAS